MDLGHAIPRKAKDTMTSTNYNQSAFEQEIAMMDYGVFEHLMEYVTSHTTSTACFRYRMGGSDVCTMLAL